MLARSNWNIWWWICIRHCCVFRSMRKSARAHDDPWSRLWSPPPGRHGYMRLIIFAYWCPSAWVGLCQFGLWVLCMVLTRSLTYSRMRWSRMLITCDDHYDDHVTVSDHRWWVYTVIIWQCGDCTWLSYVMLIYDHHARASYMMIVRGHV